MYRPSQFDTHFEMIVILNATCLKHTRLTLTSISANLQNIPIIVAPITAFSKKTFSIPTAFNELRCEFVRVRMRECVWHSAYVVLNFIQNRVGISDFVEISFNRDFPCFYVGEKWNARSCMSI